MIATERQSMFETHGPAKFYYSVLGGAHPVIRCFCGWMHQESAETWEEAGKAFDTHLRDMKRKIGVEIAHELAPAKVAAAARAAARAAGR